MRKRAVLGGFAFVMNVSRLVGSETYTLAPNHQLRRARPSEIAFIKENIRKHAPPPHNDFQGLWEQRLPLQGGQPELLPVTEQRYFVIAFTGTNQTLVDLEHAFDLSPLELEVGFTAVGFAGKRNHGVILFPGRLFHTLENVLFDNSFFVDVTAADIKEIRTIYAQLQRHDQSLLNVERLTLQLGELKTLPRHSPLRFLGYFAILESLITHNPQPADPYDSITRQVKKKLALLNSRFVHPIDYAPFGKTTAMDKIWATMYDYRSCVAHGGVPDFTKSLKILGNHGAALALITGTVKAVMRRALTEPKLLLDLREC